MTKKEKARIKAELIQVRDKKLGKGSMFICCCCKKRAANFVRKNKPSAGNAFESFTKGDLWRGSISWWGVYKAGEEGRLEELLEEKKRYLTQLIDTL